MSASTRNLGWLDDNDLQRLLRALNEDGEAKIAGGAVRNALLGEGVVDVDVATTHEPARARKVLEGAGFRVVPTGIEHGTVTAIGDGDPIEVTTLREDVETDGRHATVSFGTDWRRDAERRDLTMNALYMEADGTVYDPLGVEDDVHARRVRFVGDAETRIREDYLRSLRFFRFFAWYGAFRPDADGLRAAARTKDGLSDLSPERVWSELKRLLAAPDPGRALLWMRQTGVLSAVVPETEGWGIDAVPGLVATERAFGWTPDPLLRLCAMIRPHCETVEAVAKRLKLSNEERDRLLAWSQAERPIPSRSDPELARLMYRTTEGGTVDTLRLALAKAHAAEDIEEVAQFRRQFDFAMNWERPDMPVQGRDLIERSMTPGPAVGERLREIEDRWVKSDFALSKDELLAE